MKLNEWPFKKPMSAEDKEMLENIRPARFNFTHGFIFCVNPPPSPNTGRDARKGMPVIICSWDWPTPPAEIFYLIHHGLN
jgi:hypothetical protein